ncbi:uncharacterized protein [Heptranchias perlo]|uniref:uncharacterized protein n=1 Tax=Heptranchias perlo TaxID=212740 RepID=UPI00355AA98A
MYVRLPSCVFVRLPSRVFVRLPACVLAVGDVSGAVTRPEGRSLSRGGWGGAWSADVGGRARGAVTRLEAEGRVGGGAEPGRGDDVRRLVKPRPPSCGWGGGGGEEPAPAQCRQRLRGWAVTVGARARGGESGLRDRYDALTSRQGGGGPNRHDALTSPEIATALARRRIGAPRIAATLLRQGANRYDAGNRHIRSYAADSGLLGSLRRSYVAGNRHGARTPLNRGSSDRYDALTSGGKSLRRWKSPQRSYAADSGLLGSLRRSYVAGNRHGARTPLNRAPRIATALLRWGNHYGACTPLNRCSSDLYGALTLPEIATPLIRGSSDRYDTLTLGNHYGACTPLNRGSSDLYGTLTSPEIATTLARR